jgi:hypothetical protein
METILTNTIKNLDLETLLGGRRLRLQGVHQPEDILHLGRTNWASLAQFARENATLRQAEGADREELQMIRTGIDLLEALIKTEHEGNIAKPRLPKLRVESFRCGELVMLYIGDWVPATIVSVDKAFNPRWNDGGPNGGYYWRLTVETKTSVFADNLPIAFSTSEPRALPKADYEYLVWAQTEDAVFFDLFCANAHRTWTPLWCEERGIASIGENDVKAWFA